MKTKNQLQNEIAEISKIIIIRTDEFSGNIEEFEPFINNAIERELFALTQNDYNCRKPNREEFGNIYFNIELLKGMLDLMAKKQMLEYELEKQTAVLN
ncbi:MAG: hypothetical protein H7239_03420 [Flavobacterium sp.]|nr:hypothetical protein [Flavobacterium sp.]